MAIEYFVQFACPVREQITDRQLLDMQKSRSRAISTREALRADPNVAGSRPESEWRITVRTVGPNGVEDRAVTLDELFAESAPLDALAPHCDKCPANVMGRPFGCGGSVHYPLSAAIEQWLLARLPDDVSGERGAYMLKLFATPGLDGAAIDAARQRAEVFESRTPATRTWGGGFFARKHTVRASQILQIIMGGDSLPANEARALAWLFGYIDANGALQSRPDNSPSEADPAGVAQIKVFMICMAVAAVTGSSMFLEP